MNRFFLIALLGLVATAGWANDIQRAERPISGQYIVVLDDAPLNAVDRRTANAQRDHTRATAQTLTRQFRGRMGPVFTDSIQGFVVNLTRFQARALARDPRVAMVVEDGWVQAAGHDIQFDPPSWGLDRIDQRVGQLDGLYQHLSYFGETPVHVYVIDSGIRYTHEDFEGRVDTNNAFNAHNDGYGVEGCHGHGTHVAGIIGGRDHGVAKNVILHPVRVLNCWNSGPLSAVIAGVDWVTAQVNEHPHAAVANMSLIAGASMLLDQAVRNSIAAGVTYVVAAGNNAADACDYSPARFAEAITVGSSTAQDSRAPSSNHGSCVDIYAPGVSIVSTYNRSDTDSVAMSGTSMAAPHVAGIAAKLLAQAPELRPADVFDLVLDHATTLDQALDGTGNQLLAFGLIDLDDENEPTPEIQLAFTSECHQRTRQCIFNASISGNDSEVARYFWDFGDGNSHEHRRPVARNRYVNSSGSVTVVLGVLLENGEQFLVDQLVELPF
jgi:subtilisin family serine protease